MKNISTNDELGVVKILMIISPIFALLSWEIIGGYSGVVGMGIFVFTLFLYGAFPTKYKTRKDIWILIAAWLSFTILILYNFATELQPDFPTIEQAFKRILLGIEAYFFIVVIYFFIPLTLGYFSANILRLFVDRINSIKT